MAESIDYTKSPAQEQDQVSESKDEPLSQEQVAVCIRQHLSPVDWKAS